MNKELKKLQNLYSWEEFYSVLGQYNPTALNKVRDQIKEQTKVVYNRQ